MADQRITDLASDAAQPNVARNDVILISRNGVDRQARFNGALLLPNYDATTDRGKTLTIDDATGNVVWSVADSRRYAQILSINNPTSPATFSFNLSARYKDIYLLFNFGSGVQRGMPLIIGAPRSYSGDGLLSAWLEGGDTRIAFARSGLSSPLNLRAYGRR